jgi:hypothetical protein
MKIHISEDMGADLNLSAFCGDEDDPQVPALVDLAARNPAQRPMTACAGFVSQPMRLTKPALFDSIALRRRFSAWIRLVEIRAAQNRKLQGWHLICQVKCGPKPVRFLNR